MAKKANKGPSVSSYFKDVFKEHPEWLKLDNNDALRARWKEDHNGEDMPLKVAGIMSNVKSKLRLGKGRRRRGRKPGPKPKVQGAPVAAVAPRAAVSQLERLELMIDDCLSAARSMNVQNIEGVVKSLRNARNGIVMMFDRKS